MNIDNKQSGKIRQHSIATIVIILVLVLVVIVIVSVFNKAKVELLLYTGAKEIIQNNLIVDRLLQSAQNLAFERGRSNVVLNGANPISDKDRLFIETRRKNADEALITAINLLGGEAPELVKIKNEHLEIIQLRTEVDKAFSVPALQRPKSIKNIFVESQTMLLKNITDFVEQLTQQTDRFTPAYRVFSRIKVLAFEMRDYFGLESSRYASFLAGAPPTPSAIAEARELRGLGAATWVNLKRGVALLGNDPLFEALTVVDERLFGKFQPLEDNVVAAVMAGQTKSIPTSDFTDASIPALDSIVAFMSVATNETAAYAAVTVQLARKRMIVYLCGAMLAFAAGLTTLYVIILRLLVPLHKIQLDLEALTTGDSTIALSLSARGDEIGLMRNAVIAFRDSLIQRNALEKELKEQSIRDPLTGLFNRRYLDEISRHELARATRSRTSVGLMIIDIDHFKRFNDTFGHDAGDMVLEAVALSLSENVRGGDLVCRFGGEEFVVLLPGTSLDQVKDRSELLRQAVKNLTLSHNGFELDRLSISIGAASFPYHGQTLATVLSAADGALYRAKLAGRDRVVVAGGPAAPV
jgi:diguanylate cyclase (GGDEF)-like protein